MGESIELDTSVQIALTAALCISARRVELEEGCRQVLELLRSLQPGTLNVLRTDALLAVRQQDAQGAVRALTVLLETDAGPERLSEADRLLIRAMLAVCLCAQDDPAGYRLAHDVAAADADGPASRLVQQLIGSPEGTAASY